jgi:hypothetical protein
MSPSLESFDAKAAHSEFLAMAATENLEFTNQEDWPKIEAAVDKWVNEKYGPDKLRQALMKELKGIPQKLIDESVARCENDFKALKAEFKEALLKRRDSYGKNLKGAMENAKIRHEGLHIVAGNEAKLSSETDEMQAVIEKSATVNANDLSEFRDEAEKALLEEFIPALNEKYMNLDWQERTLQSGEFREYKGLARDFKGRMRENAKEGLARILMIEDSQNRKVEFGNLINKVDKTYETYAGEDKVMDLKDLRSMSEMAKKNADFAEMLLSEQDEEKLMKIMEAKDFYAHRELAEGSVKITDAIIKKVTEDGAEKKFIDAVKARVGDKGKLLTDYDEARTVFQAEVKNRCKENFKEGVKLVREVEEEVYGELRNSDKLENQSEPFRKMVASEKAGFLADAQLVNVDDINLRAFMRLKTRSEREEALAGPQAAPLFKSIKNILKREGNDEAEKFIPKEGDKVIWKGYDASHPSNHNLAARHLAVLGLAKEAEFLVTNLASTETLKGLKIGEKDIGEKYMDTDADENPPQSSYKYKFAMDAKRARYESGAERVGFNRRGIGMALLQTWGVVTFLMNAKAAWSGLDKIDEMIGKMATNPYIYAGSAAVLGPHALKKDPKSLEYFTQTKGGQERIAQHWKLHDIKGDKAVGYQNLKNFIGNGEEDAAMRNLLEKDKGENGKRTELLAVLAKAEKRSMFRPVLEKKDLEGYLDQKVIDNLPSSTLGMGKTQERTRYLFYKKFLTDPKVNLTQLKANCNSWQG